MDNQAITEKIFTTHSVEETKQLASCLAQYVKPGDVILLKGDLGAGKTQFSQGLAVGLGITDAVISPTFNILLEYHTGCLPLYHFDLYRLNSADELDDIAFYETVEGCGVSVIEWWDKFPDCMPEECLSIEILQARVQNDTSYAQGEVQYASQDMHFDVQATQPSAQIASQATQPDAQIAQQPAQPATQETPQATQLTSGALSSRTFRITAKGKHYVELTDLWLA